MYQILPPGLRALEHGGPCSQGPPCCLALQGHGTVTRPLRPFCAERPGTASGVRPAPLEQGRPLSTDPQFLSRLRSPAADGGSAAADPPGRLCAAGGYPCPLPSQAGASAAGASRRIGMTRGPARPGGPHPGAAAPGAFSLGICRGGSPGKNRGPGEVAAPRGRMSSGGRGDPGTPRHRMDGWKMVVSCDLTPPR